MIIKSKIDNNTIKMMWAKLPTFEKKYQEATNDALVSFRDFIPSTIFEKIKPFWQGYVEYNGKKTAVYKIDIIEFLLSQTYNINIDGTVYIKSVKEYPGSLIINKLLNLCKDSDIDEIAKMSKKQRSLLIYSQIKQDLWALFEPAEEIPVMRDKGANFEWIDVKATSNERMYSFDLTNGALYYEETRWFNNEKSISARFAKLKNEKDNVKLFKLVVEYKKYGKVIDELMNEDFQSKWIDGFDSSSYASKGKRVNATPKEEAKFHRKEESEKEMRGVVFEIPQMSEQVEKDREQEIKSINKNQENYINYIKVNMDEKKEEIEASFEAIEIITNESSSGSNGKFLDELKSLDIEDLGDLDDFLNS